MPTRTNRLLVPVETAMGKQGKALPVASLVVAAASVLGLVQLLRTRKRTRDSGATSINKLKPKPKLREKAVLFGDSITQYSFANVGLATNGGWGSLLAGTYARTVDVVNRGFSGYTTRWALDIVDTVLGVTGSRGVKDEDKLLFVTIFFGANDSADPVLNPNQTVPVEEYGTNLAMLIAKAKLFARHVVIISPPPIDDEHWARHREKPSSDRVNDRTVLYVETARAAAQAGGVLFVDLFHSMLQQQQQDWKDFLIDGLHLSDTGNEFLFRELHTVLKQQAGIDEEALPLDFPLWADMPEITKQGRGLTPQSLATLPYPVRVRSPRL